MSLLCSNVIKSEDVKIKGKKVLRNFVNIDTKPEENLNVHVEEGILRKQEEIESKLQEAEMRYEEIINAAKSESDKLISQSEEEVANIEKRAYEKGYDQGIKNGYEDGYKESYEDNIEKAKYDASEIINSANDILLRTNKEVVQYMKTNKEEILSLSISIAEKVLREKFEDTSSMNNILNNLIEEYDLKQNFVIKVNPFYKESLDEEILKLKESLIIKPDVFVISDETLEKGNAVIDNEKGRLIVGIDSVLDKIKEELL